MEEVGGDWKTSAEFLLCYVGEYQSACYAVLCYSAVCYVLWSPPAAAYLMCPTLTCAEHRRVVLLLTVVRLAAMGRKWGRSNNSVPRVAHGRHTDVHCVPGQLSVECPLTCDTCVKLRSVILKLSPEWLLATCCCSCCRQG